MAGAAALGPLRALAQTPAPLVRAGVESGAETFAQLLYGADAGIFTKAGLDVEPAQFPTAGPIAAALAGGSLDVGTVDLILLANAVNRGVPIVGLAASGLFRTVDATSGLFVLPASPIHTAKDLEGKTLAVGTLVSLTSIALRMWLQKNGANPAAVSFVELKFTEMPAALARGQIDAAYITEPLVTKLGDQIRNVSTPYSVIAEVFPISVIVTTKSWIAQHPDIARRFVAATYESARWSNANQDKTAVTLAKNSQLDLALVRRMHRTQFGTTLEPAQIQPVLDAAAANKLIDRAVSANDLIARLPGG